VRQEVWIHAFANPKLYGKERSNFFPGLLTCENSLLYTGGGVSLTDALCSYEKFVFTQLGM
jgi:hypothetical protein